jgi:methionyl-tRNA formyltransferase
MRIVFLGNHTVGVRVLHTLARKANLVGVVAHPEDPEDGVRYESVFAAARELRVPAIRATGKSGALASFIAQAAPDVLWITDYRYLLPPGVCALGRLGAINLHPSLLPQYRGRAPVNWAILRGETEFGLTAHYIDDGVDTGDIVGQRRFGLTQHEDVGDALARLYPLYVELTSEVITQLDGGTLHRTPQNRSSCPTFPRRTPEDGRVDWNAPARQVWNLIRAVASPYPGAFTTCGAGTLRLWKAAKIVSFSSSSPGCVLAASSDTLLVACADAALEISHFSVDDDVSPPEVGDQLGTIRRIEDVVA